MMERTAETSPLLKARIAGVLYVIIIVTAGFAEIFVRGKLVVHGAPATTAANILAHESLYRLGGSADLVNLLCDVGLALLFYELLKPVNRSLALLAAFFRVAHVGILTVSTLFHFAVLFVLTGAHDLSVFTTTQLQEQALLFLSFHARGYTLSLVFFGFACVLLGILIYRSTFLPRVLGVLMAIAGLCYVTSMFARLTSPAFAAHLFPYILLPGALGEWSLALWLLVRGLNVQRWQEKANTARQWTQRASGDGGQLSHVEGPPRERSGCHEWRAVCSPEFHC